MVDVGEHSLLGRWGLGVAIVPPWGTQAGGPGMDQKANRKPGIASR